MVFCSFISWTVFSFIVTNYCCSPVDAKNTKQWWKDAKTELESVNLCGVVELTGMCLEANSSFAEQFEPDDSDEYRYMYIYEEEFVEEIRTVRLCNCDLKCDRYGDCCMDRSSTHRIEQGFWRCDFLRYPGAALVKYYTYAKCSSSWKEDLTVKSLCEDDIEEEEIREKHLSLLYHLPVYGNLSRMLYRNVFCATCNNDISHLQEWNMEIQCSGNQSVSDSMTNIEYHYGVWSVSVKSREAHVCVLYIKDFANTANIERRFNTRRCISSVDSCPETWTDEHVREKCRLYSLYLTADNQSIYKNYHCALCNGIEASKLNCIYIEDKLQASPPIKGASLKLLMDFNFANDDYVTGSVNPCTSGQLYDPIWKRCFTLFCGKRYKKDGDRCISTNETVETTSSYMYNMTSDCSKVLLIMSDFTVLNNRSVLINRTGKILEIGEFEVHSFTESGAWDEILACSDNIFYTINFTPPQNVLTEINLIISVLCLMLHLIVYCLLPQLRNLPGKVLMCLAASLLVADLLFLIGSTVAINSGTVCAVIGATKHFSYLASFFWMNVMAFDISKTFGSSKPRSSNHGANFTRYSLYAWCSPAIIVLVGIVTEILSVESNPYRPRYGYGVCWLSQKKGLLIFFGLPLALLLMVNIVLFSLTARSLSKTAQETKMVNKFSDKLRFFLYVKLASVLGLTWLFGFIAVLSGVEALWYPFIILIGLQGAIIFFSFTVKRKVFVLLTQKIRGEKGTRRRKGMHWLGVSKATSSSNLTTMQTTLSTPGIRTSMPSLLVIKR